ncbi:hypothetical protein JXB27_03575 [Candidatus Woesearchaeota archaeon]|nr:hypothetical protein [Candidatus Woesearchaeota archaeon]
MWPFKKKDAGELNLPPLNPPKPRSGMGINDEELINKEIPSELPPLEEPAIKVPEKETEVTEVPVETEPVSPTLRQRGNNVFIKTETHKEILTGLVDISADFENIDDEIDSVIETKTERYEKIDALQNNLEEVSKKFMLIDQTLFGG